jgi:DnaJ-class molecular chaperone
MSSTKETTIVLRSPGWDDVLGAQRPREVFTSGGHVCSVCHGDGWFFSHNDRGGVSKGKCPVCEGSGMVRAVITIVWEPEEK